MESLKIDFGSGYNHKEGYKSCDIVPLPNLDYFYDEQNDKILYLEEASVDEFYLRNVVHHIKNIEKTFKCLDKYLKKGAIITIIDVRKECYGANLFLDNLWYRGIIPREEIWFSPTYRDYFQILKSMSYRNIEYKIENEKEVSIWKKL